MDGTMVQEIGGAARAVKESGPPAPRGADFDRAVQEARRAQADPGRGGPSLSDIGHGVLDVAGMVPVIGEAADLLNAGWYLAEGNRVDAALSAAGAVPLLGNVATAGKWGRRAGAAGDALGGAVGAARRAEEAGDAVRTARRPGSEASGAAMPRQARDAPRREPSAETGQAGAGETRAREPGSREVGARDAGAREAGAREAGSRETGARETGARETGARETGARETAPGRAGAGEAGAGETGQVERAPRPRRPKPDDDLSIPAGEVSKPLPPPRQTLRFESQEAFNAAADRPLGERAANTAFEHGTYRWQTDDVGRVVEASGEVVRTKAGRRESLQRRIGHEGDATDVGFHVIADSLGGPSNRLNIVPGNGRDLPDGTVNINGSTGAYGRFEEQVRQLADSGKEVEIRIRPTYAEGNGTSRPDVFFVAYRVRDGGADTLWHEREVINLRGPARAAEP
ncbi:DNA/RNA non-specific endonuclease [Roseomonas sp. CCTCC AB2023176]|uniref:DNA/RNA non-specific endonuclease n=1 Tax=Roseomonas sp. CCTCC AB2023176 TaxID=3342640 RepID=UPI0035E39E5D